MAKMIREPLLFPRCQTHNLNTYILIIITIINLYVQHYQLNTSGNQGQSFTVYNIFATRTTLVDKMNVSDFQYTKDQIKNF